MSLAASSAGQSVADSAAGSAQPLPVDSTNRQGPSADAVGTAGPTEQQAEEPLAQEEQQEEKEDLEARLVWLRDLYRSGCADDDREKCGDVLDELETFEFGEDNKHVASLLMATGIAKVGCCDRCLVLARVVHSWRGYLQPLPYDREHSSSHLTH